MHPSPRARQRREDQGGQAEEAALSPAPSGWRRFLSRAPVSLRPAEGGGESARSAPKFFFQRIPA